MLTLCLCRMPSLDSALMNKLYVYVSDGVCVTFEHELLSNFGEVEMDSLSNREKVSCRFITHTHTHTYIHTHTHT